MKNQLEKWGFTHTGGYDNIQIYTLESGSFAIVVSISNEEIKWVSLRIGTETSPVRNCNSQFMLLTFLYQLGMIEV